MQDLEHKASSSVEQTPSAAVLASYGATSSFPGLPSVSAGEAAPAVDKAKPRKYSLKGTWSRASFWSGIDDPSI